MPSQVPYSIGRNPASVHLTRCRQLRELRLDNVADEVLPAALSACRRLERLSVGCCNPSYWTAALTQC